MDDRRVFDNRGANHGFPIKREILPPNRESINDSWFRKRLDFVRRSSKKDLLPNHFYLVLEPPHQTLLSQFMQWLLTSHVRRYHKHYGSRDIYGRAGLRVSRFNVMNT